MWQTGSPNSSLNNCRDTICILFSFFVASAENNIPKQMGICILLSLKDHRIYSKLYI